VGRSLSRPASRKAAGQSWRRSTDAVRSSAVGAARSPRVETGRQNHRLADGGLGRVEEERVEIASAGGHRVGHVLQPLRGLAVVEVSGVEFTGGPPGEEIDSDRTDLRRQV
jgi:hypothetical protein